jgi:hypothetical protein
MESCVDNQDRIDHAGGDYSFLERARGAFPTSDAHRPTDATIARIASFAATDTASRKTNVIILDHGLAKMIGTSTIKWD